MRLPTTGIHAGWLRVFSLLIPVGPSLGFGSRDERAWAQVVENLG